MTFDKQKECNAAKEQRKQMRAFTQQQAHEIEMLKTEINMLRRKEAVL